MKPLFLTPFLALVLTRLSLAGPGAGADAANSLLLFNGKDLEGWRGDGYVVEDGTLVCTPEGGNLVSERRYTHYVLEFEFKLPAGGNNGLGIHYPGDGDPADTGLELQILDDDAEKHRDLQPAQYHGSIYGLLPSKRGHLKPTGEWNRERVTVLGDSVKVELNGTLITEGKLDELEKRFPDHAGVKRRSGHIVFCGHGDRVAFRDIRIAELPPAANEAGARAEGFAPLFDGRSLAGWKAEKGSEGHWFPINGILKYDGHSEAAVKDLWTAKSFKDFTLVFDWRWPARGEKRQRPVIGIDGNETGKTVGVEEFDSGIYLRGSSKSQVNLWNWPAGSGEVYGYRTDLAQPAPVRAAVTPRFKADMEPGRWNRMMITLVGDRLTVVLNGATVIENAQLPGIPAAGPIGLQHHGCRIDFANLWIRER